MWSWGLGRWVGRELGLGLWMVLGRAIQTLALLLLLLLLILLQLASDSTTTTPTLIGESASVGNLGLLAPTLLAAAAVH